MAKENVLFERELLYGIDNPLEFGVAIVKILGVEEDNKILTIVEQKSDHDPKDYVESLLKSLNTEVFKRINVKINENVDIIIVTGEKITRVIFDWRDENISYNFEDVNASVMELIKK